MINSQATTQIGPRVRALREDMSLSLRELGNRTGVSVPMLSQVERGQTSPTLTVATKIAAGLELSLSQLLRLDEAEGVRVVRRDDRMSGRRAPGHSWEILTPGTLGQPAEVSAHTLTVGAVTGGLGDPPIHEPGSRETTVVIAGQLRLICAGVTYDLAEGDTVTFEADLPHHFENLGENEARFFAVVSAGRRN